MSDMSEKKITIPADVIVGGRNYPFLAWCAEALDAFSPCGSSPQARALHADLHVILIAAIASGADSLTLTTQQYAILAAATAAFRMQPSIGRLCVSYDIAVAASADEV